MPLIVLRGLVAFTVKDGVWQSVHQQTWRDVQGIYLSLTILLTNIERPL